MQYIYLQWFLEVLDQGLLYMVRRSLHHVLQEQEFEKTKILQSYEYPHLFQEEVRRLLLWEYFLKF